MADSVAAARKCSRPGCFVLVKPGQLACREHWYELSNSLRERLVYAWEVRKANPEIPELVNAHRALLLEAMREWKIPLEAIAMATRRMPRVIDPNCPLCGLTGGIHRPECPKGKLKDHAR